MPEVLAGCLKGKQSAQRQLFEQYYSFAKSICLRYAANTEEAEEMLNDGFLKVLAKLPYYDPSQPFEAWFRTVVVRTSIDYYRRNHLRISIIDIQDAPEIQFDDELIQKLSADEIMALVQKLPPAYRTAFSLYVVDGYSHAEIAEMLGINEGTSRSNLAKARLKLQEWIRHNLSEATPIKPDDYVQRTV
ncbi:DNA-directed RNA polymerase sigma-70 factor [Adhaeribacter aerolatus]|uniref:DNA-directed RNA polymerase sigma-70 factor n=1 Tax=Adhaeribacter aerolatus TaxID=670289 RepID=A0A512AUJ7_9BACT|nr:DNA-directed RNA polymerase sigma-70 factor [Adhaeribacter aerolatus]